MNRRLYFLLPDKMHALALVDELMENGIRQEHMHAQGGHTVRLDGQPTATRRQYDDMGRRIEALLLNSNLVVFGLARGILAALLGPIGLTAWLIIPAGIMLAILLAGLRVTRIPDTL